MSLFQKGIGVWAHFLTQLLRNKIFRHQVQDKSTHNYFKLILDLIKFFTTSMRQNLIHQLTWAIHYHCTSTSKGQIWIKAISTTHFWNPSNQWIKVPRWKPTQWWRPIANHTIWKSHSSLRVRVPSRWQSVVSLFRTSKRIVLRHIRWISNNISKRTKVAQYCKKL
jgi:hypothetical protein